VLREKGEVWASPKRKEIKGKRGNERRRTGLLLGLGSRPISSLYLNPMRVVIQSTSDSTSSFFPQTVYLFFKFLKFIQTNKIILKS